MALLWRRIRGASHRMIRALAARRLLSEPVSQPGRPPMADFLAIRVLRPDDRYPEDSTPAPVTREAQAGPWRISVTFGPIPSDIVHIIAVCSTGGNYLLDYMFG